MTGSFGELRVTSFLGMGMTAARLCDFDRGAFDFSLCVISMSLA